MAVGGGSHWGAPINVAVSEGDTGIINASDLFGRTAWIAVGTNDEGVPLNLVVWVICVKP